MSFTLHIPKVSAADSLSLYAVLKSFLCFYSSNSEPLLIGKSDLKKVCLKSKDMLLFEELAIVAFLLNNFQLSDAYANQSLAHNLLNNKNVDSLDLSNTGVDYVLSLVAALFILNEQSSIENKTITQWLNNQTTDPKIKKALEEFLAWVHFVFNH